MSLHTEINAPLAIGTPVLSSYIGCTDRLGYVAEVQAAPANLYSLGTGKMEPIRTQYVIAFDDLTFDTLTEGTLDRMVRNAARRSDLSTMEPAAVADLLARCKAETVKRRTAQQAKAAEYAVKVEAWRASVRGKIPAGAKAVIVAQLMKDESDAMTDYFHSSVQKTVVLAFSSHTRDLFPEMRKAARNYEPCAYLADSDEKAENRNKWSMGDGYYLSESGYKGSGWRIRKERLYHEDPVQNLPALCEWAVPADAPAPEPKAAKERPAKVAASDESPAPETIGGATVSQHVHSTKGFAFYIVQMSDRVDRSTFDRLLGAAKAAKGWYSRAWGDTPAGFAFKDQAAAERFAGAL